jgi:hypothetical protein
VIAASGEHLDELEADATGCPRHEHTLHLPHLRWLLH